MTRKRRRVSVVAVAAMVATLPPAVLVSLAPASAAAIGPDIIVTMAGGGTQLDLPADLAFDAAGNLYIADLVNNRVRKVDASGIITTVAGSGTAGRR